MHLDIFGLTHSNHSLNKGAFPLILLIDRVDVSPMCQSFSHDGQIARLTGLIE